MKRTKILEFRVDGEPLGKPRPRFQRRGGGVHTYTPSRFVDYERQIGAMALELAEAQGFAAPTPKELAVVAVKRRPQRLNARRHHDGRLLCPVRPDGDNVLKIVADGLERYGPLVNDAEIAIWSCECYYAARSETDHIVISMWLLEEEDETC